MMEIKARAWDYVSKQMVYGVGISEDGKAILPGYKYSIFSPPIIRMSTPMLYTGIKDKDGMDIYEGDILKDQFGTGKVRWISPKFVIHSCDEEGCNYYDFQPQCLKGKLCLANTKRIGNIHDNPELMVKQALKEEDDD